MGRAEFIPPTVTRNYPAAGAEFILGTVPSLSPEVYDPSVHTEELERAQAEASSETGQREIEELNNLFNLKSSSQGE